MFRLRRAATLAVSCLAIAACGDGSDDPGAAASGGAGLQGTGRALLVGTLVRVMGPGATGGVSIRAAEGGGALLQLAADFVVAGGPGATEVYLTKSDGAIDVLDAADVVQLGVIPQNGTGAMSFAIDSAVDLSAFSHVVVWCPQVSVTFGRAVLSEPQYSATVATVKGPGTTGSVNIAGGTLSLGSDFVVQPGGPGATEVYLVRSTAPINEQDSADYARLGILVQDHTGAKSFDLGTLDPAAYSAVMIWCPTASIVFGVGTLSLK